MKIELHIEALVLEGLHANHRDRIGQALEAALVRLFEKRGLPAGLAHGGEPSHLETCPVEVSPDDRPEFIGMQIAQAVYEGLSP